MRSHIGRNAQRHCGNRIAIGGEVCLRGLQRMEVPLPCPDHTTLSCYPPAVAIRQQGDRAAAGPLSLIVDSSGLQVCGQGAWYAQKHGTKKSKRWKKLYIGGDAQGQLVASAVTASSAQDPSHVPALLSQVDRQRVEM